MRKATSSAFATLVYRDSAGCLIPRLAARGWQKSTVKLMRRTAPLDLKMLRTFGQYPLAAPLDDHSARSSFF
jgi:hypothetical protein